MAQRAGLGVSRCQARKDEWTPEPQADQSSSSEYSLLGRDGWAPLQAPGTGTA